VEVDVRTAYIEVDRTKQQIAATSVTRRFNEEKLRTETEKLRVGKSTSFLVAQAQRDLLVSRIAEVQALANYLKALIDSTARTAPCWHGAAFPPPGANRCAVQVQQASIEPEPTHDQPFFILNNAARSVFYNWTSSFGWVISFNAGQRKNRLIRGAFIVMLSEAYAIRPPPFYILLSAVPNGLENVIGKFL
jgi:hypothetical protein